MVLLVIPESSPIFVKVQDDTFQLDECPYSDEELLTEVVEKSTEIVNHLFERDFTVCGKRVKLSVDDISLEADMVLVDNENIPTILELKLLRNREIRREVIAQLIEYITAVYLDPDSFKRGCQRFEGDWDELEKNLRQRRIRGVIVADELPEIVKRTIELLNEELRNIEIYGVELKRFCDKDSNLSAIVPSIIGYTAETVSSGKTRSKKWRYEELRDVITEEVDNPKLRDRLLILLQWAKKEGVFLESRAKHPTFGLKDAKTGERVATVYLDGRIDVCIGRSCKLDKARRQGLLTEFRSLGLLKDEITDPDTLKYTKRTVSIAELSGEEFNKMLEALRKHLVA